jgi:hypothetical protein
MYSTWCQATLCPCCRKPQDGFRPVMLEDLEDTEGDVLELGTQSDFPPADSI